METIKPAGRVESAVVATERVKARLAKKLVANAGALCSCFLLLVTALVLTTDVSALTDPSELKAMGTSFVVLLFLTYSMYFSCSGSGARAGESSATYLEACARYEQVKAAVAAEGSYEKLRAFCRSYVRRELEAARAAILSECGLEAADLEAYRRGERADFSKRRLRALARAEALKPVRLTADMLMRRGRRPPRRAPLGLTPTKRKNLHDAISFLKITATSLLTGTVVIEVVIDFSWSAVVALFFKLMPVVVNGFYVYKAGLENVIVDSVDYMNDQTDVLKQALAYTAEKESEARRAE